MNSNVQVALHFKGIAHDETLDQILKNHCHRVAAEFQETNHLELTLSVEAGEISCHVHASGKKTRVASHALAADARKAGDIALNRLERELRRLHDKRIFGGRRVARQERNRHPAATSSSEDQV